MKKSESEDESLGVGVQVEPEASTPTPRTHRAPPVEDFEDESGSDDVLLAADVPQRERMPLFQGVKAVYIGADPNHAPTLRGRVTSENVGGMRKEKRGLDGALIVTILGGTIVEKAVVGNFTNYDFRAYDLAGVKSSTRIPLNHKYVELRDRPYRVVKHPDHIYHFLKHPQDYHVVVGPESRFALREYIAARERSRKLHQQLLDKTTAAA